MNLKSRDYSELKIKIIYMRGYHIMNVNVSYKEPTNRLTVNLNSKSS